jgi:IS5 family transposase
MGQVKRHKERGVAMKPVETLTEHELETEINQRWNFGYDRYTGFIHDSSVLGIAQDIARMLGYSLILDEINLGGGNFRAMVVKLDSKGPGTYTIRYIDAMKKGDGNDFPTLARLALEMLREKDNDR